MSTKTHTPSELIHSTFAFLHSIPPNFIEVAWPEAVHGHFHRHLKYKYLNTCMKEGYASPTAIIKFYASLDAENSRIFLATMQKLMK